MRRGMTAASESPFFSFKLLSKSLFWRCASLLVKMHRGFKFGYLTARESVNSFSFVFRTLKTKFYFYISIN